MVTSPFGLETVPAALLIFGRILGLDPLYPCCSFKPQLSLCVPGHPGWVGAGCSELARVAGWLFCPDPAPICAIKVEGECKPWHLPVPLTQESFSSSLAIWQSSRAYSSWSFNRSLFSVLQSNEYAHSPSVLFLPVQFAVSGEGISFITVFPPLLPFSVFYHVQKLFVQTSVLQEELLCY